MSYERCVSEWRDLLDYMELEEVYALLNEPLAAEYAARLASNGLPRFDALKTSEALDVLAELLADAHGDWREFMDGKPSS